MTPPLDLADLWADLLFERYMAEHPEAFEPLPPVAPQPSEAQNPAA